MRWGEGVLKKAPRSRLGGGGFGVGGRRQGRLSQGRDMAAEVLGGEMGLLRSVEGRGGGGGEGNECVIFWFGWCSRDTARIQHTP